MCFPMSGRQARIGAGDGGIFADSADFERRSAAILKMRSMPAPGPLGVFQSDPKPLYEIFISHMLS
jgi:hypothetical protein